MKVNLLKVTGGAILLLGFIGIVGDYSVVSSSIVFWIGGGLFTLGVYFSPISQINKSRNSDSKRNDDGKRGKKKCVTISLLV